MLKRSLKPVRKPKKKPRKTAGAREPDVYRDKDGKTWIVTDSGARIPKGFTKMG